MINKLNHLSDTELKLFYKTFAEKLLQVFSNYDYENVEDLQEAFNNFKNEDVKDYRDCLDNILKDISPQIELNWRDCKKLNKNRWKFAKCAEHLLSLLIKKIV